VSLHDAPTVADSHVNFDFVMARMREIRMRVAGYHSIDRLVYVFFSAATFADRRTVLAGSAKLTFKKAIIATGARPRPSNIPGLDQIGFLTSSTVFDISKLPPRLAVIGGGPSTPPSLALRSRTEKR
jgi:pyruvate/2-oxoglutarate dehydrogenase complex dihydrolipoamide dehydrogenase (E3) component